MPEPRGKRAVEPAPELPVAQVAVDMPLPHLDRPFDYLVTAAQHEQVVPGCRVRVRFAGQLVDGFVLNRLASSAHVGKLAPLAKVVASEAVLTGDIAELARAVADRYAGTLADVLRLAIPPRHAAAEKEAIAAQASPSPPAKSVTDPWGEYTNGAAFIDALTEGRSPRAVWSALPGRDWPLAIAMAVRAARARGRGVVVVVPDRRDIDRVSSALDALLGAGQHVVLTADLGPRERYRRWLAVLRGTSQVVLGTRSAAFAPVKDLGLVVIWDDGDDLHADQRAPYAHAREVLALRSHLHEVALLVAGHARTAEAASMVGTGFARSVVAPRANVKAHAPRVRASDDGTGSDPAASAARLPHMAWRTAKDSLKVGPVLVQVPRRGYVPAVACQRCRTRASCGVCHGPLVLPRKDAPPVCRWCGTVATSWRCEECGYDRLHALVVGARRTAEELGRAFPGVPVVTSGGEKVATDVSDRPALVIATPGAEPWPAAGYAAALLLDTWALLGRVDLRANEETLRRWMTAAALVRPASDGGQVVVVADASLRTVQALVRWDPVGHAARELDDRIDVGLPPAQRVAMLTGPGTAVSDLLRRAELPAAASVLGPTPLDDEQVRTLVRGPRAAGLAMAEALRRAAGERSARKESAVVNIRIDPQELG